MHAYNPDIPIENHREIDAVTELRPQPGSEISSQNHVSRARKNKNQRAILRSRTGANLSPNA